MPNNKLAEPSGSTLELTLTKPHALGDCGACGVTLATAAGKRKNGVYAIVMGSTFRERTKHVVVASATGKAAEAGLLVHDELLAFNNEPIESVHHCVAPPAPRSTASHIICSSFSMRSWSSLGS